jgi:predicted nucleotidyltransferase
MNIIEQNISEIYHLCEIHRVNKLYLFGSVLSNRFTKESDIDFLVSFNSIELLKYADNYFNLKFSLEELLERPIDLLEEQSIKNPYFLDSINESKRLIYGSRD